MDELFEHLLINVFFVLTGIDDLHAFFFFLGDICERTESFPEIRSIPPFSGPGII